MAVTIVERLGQTNAKLFVGAFLFSACLGSAQTTAAPQYDLRHVRWGMTLEEVHQAEPKLMIGLCKSGTPEFSCWVFGETISGITTDIMYSFQKNHLIGVWFIPQSTGNDSDTKNALYAWYDALTSKYGEGYLFLGTARVGYTISLNGFDADVTRFLKENAGFHVQFQHDRTIIHLMAAMLSLENKPVHATEIEFFPKADDNF